MVRIAHNTVTETRAYNDQQIALCHTEVGCLGSVHTDHTGIKDIGSVKCTFTHQAVPHRRLNFMCKCA